MSYRYVRHSKREAMATSPGLSDWESRTNKFRKMICGISDDLKDSEVSQVKYLRNISTSGMEGLDVLASLEKRGDFSPNNTESLVTILTDVHRHDLAERVKNEYQAQFPNLAKDEVEEDNIIDVFPAEFNRVKSRSLPFKKSRTVVRPLSESDTTLAIEFKLPLTPTRRRSRVSTISILSSNSAKGTSCTSLRVIEDKSPRVLNVQQQSVEREETSLKLEDITDPENIESSMQTLESLYPKKQGWKQKLLGPRAEKGERLSRVSKYNWNIHKEILLPILLQKAYIQRIACPEHPPIDIGCGEANPYVTLCLYPLGLFDDFKKSMSLQYKVVIPDDCPPIPTKAYFSISWDVFARGEVSSRPLKSQQKQVKFKTGLGYIYKFLSYHQMITQEHDFKALEISVQVSTSFSESDIS